MQLCVCVCAGLPSRKYEINNTNLSRNSIASKFYNAGMLWLRTHSKKNGDHGDAGGRVRSLFDCNYWLPWSNHRAINLSSYYDTRGKVSSIGASRGTQYRWKMTNQHQRRRESLSFLLLYFIQRKKVVQHAVDPEIFFFKLERFSSINCYSTDDFCSGESKADSMGTKKRHRTTQRLRTHVQLAQ